LNRKRVLRKEVCLGRGTSQDYRTGPNTELGEGTARKDGRVLKGKYSDHTQPVQSHEGRKSWGGFQTKYSCMKGKAKDIIQRDDPGRKEKNPLLSPIKTKNIPENLGDFWNLSQHNLLLLKEKRWRSVLRNMEAEEFA